MKIYNEYLYIMKLCAAIFICATIFSCPNVYSSSFDCTSLRLNDLTIKNMENDEIDYKILSQDNQNNDGGHFDFIKSENAINIFGDAKLFLYLGVSLIAVSIVGILLTIIPKKRRSKRTSKRKRKR